MRALNKTRPFITERLLMGRKESNQTKQNMHNETSQPSEPYFGWGPSL